MCDYTGHLNKGLKPFGYADCAETPVNADRNFSLDEEGLGIVISLVDQLHGARAELSAVFAALEEAPTDVRTKVAKALSNIRFGD